MESPTRDEDEEDNDLPENARFVLEAGMSKVKGTEIAISELKSVNGTVKSNVTSNSNKNI